MANSQKNGLGVAGFVVSLIGAILSWIPLINVFGVILCVIGFILALIGCFKRPRGLAIAGVILAIIGGVLYYIVWSRVAEAAKTVLESAIAN